MLFKLSDLDNFLSYHPYWKKLKEREKLIVFNIVSNLIISTNTSIGQPKNNSRGWQSVHTIPTIPNLYQQNIESLGFSSYKMIDYELSSMVDGFDLETRKILYTICLNKIKALRTERYLIDYVSQDKVLEMDFPVGYKINWSIDNFNSSSFDSHLSVNCSYEKVSEDVEINASLTSEIKYVIDLLREGVYESNLSSNVFYSTQTHLSENTFDSNIPVKINYEISQMITDYSFDSNLTSLIQYEIDSIGSSSFTFNLPSLVKYEISGRWIESNLSHLLTCKVNYEIQDAIIIPSTDFLFTSNVRYSKKKITQAYDSTNSTDIILTPVVRYTKLTI